MGANKRQLPLLKTVGVVDTRSLMTLADAAGRAASAKVQGWSKAADAHGRERCTVAVLVGAFSVRPAPWLSSVEKRHAGSKCVRGGVGDNAGYSRFAAACQHVLCNGWRPAACGRQSPFEPLFCTAG